MIIDLDKLHNYLWAWYYEEFGRGKIDTLSKEEADALYDCMVVINQLKKKGISILDTEKGIQNEQTNSN